MINKHARFREIFAQRLGLDHNWKMETHTKSQIIQALDYAEDKLAEEVERDEAAESIRQMYERGEIQ